MLFGQQLRLGLTKAHGLAATALHLAEDEEPEADQQQDWQRIQQDRAQRNTVIWGNGFDAHAATGQGRYQIWIIRRIGFEVLTGRILTGDFLTIHPHTLHGTGIDLLQEFRIGGAFRLHLIAPAIKLIDQEQQ